MSKSEIQNVKKTEFDPPNVIVGKNKSGFFQQATYKIGDVYVDPDQIKRNYEKEKIKKRIHEEPFRTTGYKQIVSSAYKYQEQNKQKLDFRKLRDEDGRVIVGYANIKTGQHLLNKLKVNNINNKQVL
ncbi:hypothetical protein TTHERM_00079690 (macronuclear) [Tetrahymena thermophila SB210]|uniref:Uncharacterized protein n=1 Tax=Tetrahymena thermophila (strain SB210) TaxID=312017 RepID=Q23FP6_TETTS|nr:hypothetical protein TTHERM_00079690 [Tetrahymena thermophila SB210]EAR95564.3 hypothetical protein TTHERM_00079690 [Tetrahymena thermophila SB210]|eukprot:XP_001015809.3 hypothetical protein TTHERM_00079690 [Tetrahymena thermophila SB210]